MYIHVDKLLKTFFIYLVVFVTSFRIADYLDL